MSLRGRLMGEKHLQRELDYVLGTIAATEADIRFLLAWIRDHPDDPHVKDYRFLIRVDERTLRDALRRRASLQRRQDWIAMRGRGRPSRRESWSLGGPPVR